MLRVRWAHEGVEQLTVGVEFPATRMIVDKWIRSTFEPNDKVDAREIETLHLLATALRLRIDRVVGLQIERETDCGASGIRCVDHGQIWDMRRNDLDLER